MGPGGNSPGIDSRAGHVKRNACHARESVCVPGRQKKISPRPAGYLPKMLYNKCIIAIHRDKLHAARD